MSLRALLCLLSVVGLTSASRAAAEPPLWRAKGAHAEVDLFGSIHLLSTATQWKSPALLAELGKAEELWFEIPLGAGSQAQTTELVRAKGVLPAGRTLAAEIGPELDARVHALAVGEGLDPAVLEHLRPWFVELELTVVFYQRQGYSEDLGVESEIDAAAPAAAPRKAFETVAEQIALFADEPLSEQVASLKETLDEIATDPGVFARAADDWRRGDVAGLEREVIAPMRKEDEALYRRVIVERNRRFADRIEALLKGDRRVFVVVGAGHLIGPDGVPAMLRRDGIKVEGP